MANTFLLSILTPEHEFYRGQVQMLNVSALDGELSILPGHAPTVISLTEGELTLRDENGQTRWAAASDGFMTVTQDETVVMLQSAEWPQDIDRVRAERAEAQAREATRLMPNDPEARTLLADALSRHQGNVTQAARDLGLERTNLHKRIRALDLRKDQEDLRNDQEGLRDDQEDGS